MCVCGGGGGGGLISLYLVLTYMKYICSAQSKNPYNSVTVLRKVGILTLSANSGIVPEILELRKGYMLKIDQVHVPV